MLCGPYLTAADATICPPATPDLERAILVASWLMYAATGRQYPGLCADVVRPCSGQHPVQMLDYPTSVGGARPIGWTLDLAACGCGGSGFACGCTYHDAVRLPGLPVARVTEVLVDGVALDVTPGTGDVVLVDSAAIIRADGGHWPCCQNLALPTDQPGTWQVSYEWGALAPPDVVAGAEALACELAAAWGGGACNLPKRLTSLTFEGATMAVLDPFDFLDSGRFGVYLADAAVAAHNPGRLDRTRTVTTPSEFLAGLHRRTR